MSYEYYSNHIAAYEREFRKWEGRVEKIIKRYRDEGRRSTDGAKFNVLWSNVQTLKAATYSRLPMPDVSRRFKDNDPVGRVAALILERALEFDVKHFRDYGATMGQCVYDRFLGGRGTAWVRYEPVFEAAEAEVTEDIETETPTAEQLSDEHCPTDYVHWRDFGHAVARTWEECPIVWRKVYMTEQAVKKRFPDEKIPADTLPDEKGSLKQLADTDAVGKRALIYELWDKETGKAIWLSKSLGKIVDERDDPLGLEEFFPCPPPIYSTLNTDTLVPVPDFTVYQDQANELDILSDRIDGLVKALQLKGGYDGSIPELGRLFTEGENGTLIPIKNWAAFAEKQGLKGAISLVDLQPIAMALREAYLAFSQVKSQIYELTSISDILRGETSPSETATAQQIKNSYASLRLKVYQDEVEKFATRLLQLKAQIICNKFSPETLAKLASVDQFSDADKQLVGPAMQMLKSGVLRSFRIEVATDSMVYQDEQQEKQDRMEFLNATGNMLKLVMEAGQMSPVMVPLGIELLKFGVTGFRVGKNLEGTIDQAIEQLKAVAQQQMQQPPKPDPKMAQVQANAQQAQAAMQADMQGKQLAEQAETGREQMRLAADQQEAERQRQHEAQMTLLNAKLQERDWQYQQQMQAQNNQHAAALAQVQGMLQQVLQRMKGDTAVEVAEISAGATLDAAQVSAARSADA